MSTAGAPPSRTHFVGRRDQQKRNSPDGRPSVLRRLAEFQAPILHRSARRDDHRGAPGLSMCSEVVDAARAHVRDERRRSQLLRDRRRYAKGRSTVV